MVDVWIEATPDPPSSSIALMETVTGPSYAPKVCVAPLRAIVLVGAIASGGASGPNLPERRDR